MKEPKLCKCGCGGYANPGRRFIRGHSGGVKKGHIVTQETRDKIRNTLTGRKTSKETKQKQSNAALGKKKSPEHCKNISIAQKKSRNTPEYKAAASKAQKKVKEIKSLKMIKVRMEEPERWDTDNVKHGHDDQRGGQDIVKHHYIYDHNDLLLYTIEMTRSKHTQIHWCMRKEGIEVPHINTEIGYGRRD